VGSDTDGVTRRALLLFIGLGIAWGIPYLLIKVAVEEMSPAELVLSRTAIAALILMPIAIARGAIRPVLARWRWLVVFALVEIAIPWVFLGSAETRLPSSTTGLLIAAVPLAGVAVAFLTGRSEPMPLSAWAGIGLGIAGVAALVGLDVAGSDLGAVAEVAVVVVGYAIGPAILARQLRGLPGIGVMALALTLTALAYVPIVLAFDGVPAGVPSGDVVVSVLLLATVCTAAAFMLLFALVGEVGPVRATTITYVNPAVAVIAGVLVLDEPMTIWTVLGFTLVVSGSYLVNRRPRASRAPAAAAEAVSEVTEAADHPAHTGPAASSGAVDSGQALRTSS
jgi:drug/metabolite transporter (DMT)-like permease